MRRLHHYDFPTTKNTRSIIQIHCILIFLATPDGLAKSWNDHDNPVRFCGMGTLLTPPVSQKANVMLARIKVNTFVYG